MGKYTRLVFCVKIACCAGPIFISAGCASVKQQLGVSMAVKQPEIFRDETPTRFRYTEVTAATTDNRPYFRTAYDQAIQSRNYNDARLSRDAVVLDVMREVDRNYFAYEQRLKMAMSGKDLAFDVTVLALNTLATAMTPPGTKTVLSAISTGLVGTELALDKAAFREKTLEILLSQMRAARSEIEPVISKNLRADSIELRDGKQISYGLDEALRDLGKYYVGGTVTNAFVAMHQTASANAQDKEQKAQENREGIAEDRTKAANLGRE